MKIIQITPGSGDSFYCENCIRDLAVVKALRKAGHKTLIVPLYLPILGKGAGEGEGPIFFGGINVYLQQTSAIFRHTPRWLDRLFDSPRLLSWAGRKAGMTSARSLGRTMLSMLRGEHGRQKKELTRLVDWLARNERPDVVSLSDALLLGLARKIKKTLGARIICWLQDEDEFVDALDADQRTEAWRIMAQRAAEVDAFIAPSRYYADVMQSRLGLPSNKVHVIYDGMDWSAHSPAAPPAVPVIGYFSRICVDKGLDILVEAFAAIKKDSRMAAARLRAAGGMTGRDRPFVDSITRRVDELGLGGDVELLPNLQDGEKVRFLQSLSVLSVPEKHGESAGLYVMEALACGVPVVQPRNGAFPELIEMTGGGLLFEPGRAEALADALLKVLTDRDYARQLGRRGRQAALQCFSVDKVAENFIQVCRRTLAEAKP
ncbi:MAG: glycosyltransferase family 4 protein [Phycisphaerae bacterium]